VERYDQRYLRRAHHLHDTEKSNWSWTGGPSILASFFSHQPDLNYDNPP